MGHHKHSPSCFARREACAYSGIIEPISPNTGSAQASEGTMLHERMEEKNFNGLTKEQKECCEWAQECVVNIHETHGRPIEMHQELSMELLSNSGEVLTYGTADLVFVYDDHIVVADYKFGFGFTSAFKNKQLWLYSLMAMQRFDKDEATVYIIQPRCDYLGEYNFSYVSSSIDYIEEILQLCDTATPADATPNAKACKYCNGRHDCPALKESEDALTKYESNDISAMSVEQCGDTLSKIDQVRDLMNGMEKQLLTRFETAGDLDDYFAYKDEYKQGSVKFDELIDHITFESLSVKGFSLTQAEFENAYVNKNKKGVRGEVAGLRESAKEIYKKLKKTKTTKKGVRVVRR